MNLLNRDEPIVVLKISAKPRHICTAGESQKLRRIGKEELHRQPVTLSHSIVNVGIELMFVIRRNNRSGVMTIGLRSRDEKLAVRQFGVQDGKCYRVNRCREHSVRQLWSE